MPDELQPIVIDFNEYSKDTLNESFLKMFGFAVKNILKYMFDDAPIPVKVKGHPSHDPRTLQDKSILTQSVRKFERATGLKWPFK